MQEFPPTEGFEGFEHDDAEKTGGKTSPEQEVTQEVPQQESYECDDAEMTSGKISPEREVMQEVPPTEGFEHDDARQDGHENGVNNNRDFKEIEDKRANDREMEVEGHEGDDKEIEKRADDTEMEVEFHDVVDRRSKLQDKMRHAKWCQVMEIRVVKKKKIEGEGTVIGDGNGKIFTEYRNQKDNDSDDGDSNHDKYSGGKTVTDDDDDKKVEPFKPLSSSSSEIEEIGFVKSTSKIPSRFEATPQFNPFKVDAYLAQKYKSCLYDKPSEDESDADEDMMIPIIRRSQRIAQKDWFMGVRRPFSETLREKRWRIEEVLERDRYSDCDDDVKKTRAQGCGRGRGRGRGRARAKGQARYDSYMSPPHDWEQPDWRVRSHSVQGIANLAPMDYQQVINQMEESDLSKDKEMMSILEDIKAKSLFFGDSEGFEMSDTNLASLIPDVDLSDESKAMLTLLGKSSNNKSDDSHGHASIGKSSSNNSDDSHGDACIGKSSSNSSDDSHGHACIGIRKDYSTNDCTKSPVVEEQLQVIDPNQLYKVDRDDEMQKLSDKCENGWKYVTTLKAYMELCSEEEEEGEETEILEVKQSSVSRMDMRRFYGKKVMERTAASRDVYRLKLLKTFVARERAEKARCRLNQSDSMHSDTSINSDNVSDISLVSNTTYSDESESMDKKKSKEEKQKETKAAVAVVKTSEESDASLVPSVGSMWSGDQVIQKVQNQA